MKSILESINVRNRLEATPLHVVIMLFVAAATGSGIGILMKPGSVLPLLLAMLVVTVGLSVAARHALIAFAAIVVLSLAVPVGFHIALTLELSAYRGDWQREFIPIAAALLLLINLLPTCLVRFIVRPRRWPISNCCQKCGYDLRGSVSCTCPECGAFTHPESRPM